jgi:hypothetical protein
MLRAFNAGVEAILGHNVFCGIDGLKRQRDDFLRMVSGSSHSAATPEMRVGSFSNGPEQ